MGWRVLLTWTAYRSGGWQGILGHELQGCQRTKEDSVGSRMAEKSHKLCALQVNDGENNNQLYLIRVDILFRAEGRGTCIWWRSTI